jgi:hypothetical protein
MLGGFSWCKQNSSILRRENYATQNKKDFKESGGIGEGAEGLQPCNGFDCQGHTPAVPGRGPASEMEVAMNHIEQNGGIFWKMPLVKVGGSPVAYRLIPEERIARYLMLELRRCGSNGLTCRTLRMYARNSFHIHFSDKDMRGILRRMQVQGKPVVSTFHGFALATKKQVEQQAKRMLRHGWAEVLYAKSLVNSRLFDRLVGQMKVKLRA